MKYEIYNTSVVDMKEVPIDSIDLIVFSPPYNIKTTYDDFSDNLTHAEYLSFMRVVIKASVEKLNKEGRLVIEVADSVYANGMYIQLAGLLQMIAIKECGLFLEARHINFVKSKKGFELPDHGFNNEYTAMDDTHSNAHQILVFSKEKVEQLKGGILYCDYEGSTTHPCPQPKALIEFILDNYFSKGMSALDPFMGTAGMGREVLKRDGIFYGYEIVEGFYKEAEKNLSFK